MKYLITIVYLSIAFSSISQTKNGNRTVTLGYDPSIEKFKLLRAVDFNDKDLFKPSPFIYSIDSSTNYVPNVILDAYIIKNSLESNRFLDVDIKVDATLPWVDLKGEDEYYKSTNIKDNTYSLVLSIQSIYNPEIPNDNKIELTTEAKKLLKNPTAFINTYGNYFCSAVYKGNSIKIEINLKNKFTTELENYFHHGTAKVPLEILNFDIESQIKLELKTIAAYNQGGITVRTIGGPAVSEYKGLVVALFKGEKNYSEITDSIGKLIAKINYSSAKPMKVELSDYYSWGIDKNALILDAIINTQIQIKKLSRLVKNELDLITEISTNPFFNTIYNREQIDEADSNHKKLLDLYNQMLNCHEELNNGNKSMIGKDLQFQKQFINIKNTDPQVFDYLAARLPNTSASKFYYFFSGGLNDYNFNNLKTIVTQTLLFNTLNSKNVFNFISNINITNDLTGEVINVIKLNTFQSTKISLNNGLATINLIDLVGDVGLGNFIQNIDRDLLFTADKFFREGRIPRNERFQYSINIKDQISRTYSFPFLDINYTLPSNGVLLVAHGLSENCCKSLLDYEEQDIKSEFSLLETPLGFKLSLRDLKLIYTDSLIIEISTDNTNVNRAVLHDLDFRLGNADFLELAQNPFLNLNFIKDYASQIHFFYFKWYSKKNTGVIDSKVYEMSFPVDKVLCSRTIYLTPNIVSSDIPKKNNYLVYYLIGSILIIGFFFLFILKRKKII